MKCYYLKPKSPFHLQAGSLDHESVDEFPRSDTLSSALSSLWFREYGEVPGFPDEMPFLISSAFPVLKLDGVKKHFYPKPIGIGIDPNEVEHKLVKKVRYFDQTLFSRWANGDWKDAYWPGNSDDPRLDGSKTLLAAEVVSDNMWNKPVLKKHVYTRVVLDRVTSASTPFHFVSVRYNEHVRLGILADVDPAYEVHFRAMLRLLGDEGIGADRTVGMGQFDVEAIEDIKLPVPENDTGRWYNLGVFNPSDKTADDEISWEDSAYGLQNRYGWVSGTSLRRRPLAVLTEASVLECESSPKGTVRLVLDPETDPLPEEQKEIINHKIYRDARGFLLPVSPQ